MESDMQMLACILISDLVGEMSKRITWCCRPAISYICQNLKEREPLCFQTTITTGRHSITQIPGLPSSHLPQTNPFWSPI